MPNHAKTIILGTSLLLCISISSTQLALANPQNNMQDNKQTAEESTQTQETTQISDISVSPTSLPVIDTTENEELMPFDSSIHLEEEDKPYKLYKVDQPNKSWSIRVHKAGTGHASILINNKEVMRFRKGFDDLNPYERANVVAQRLYTYLNQPEKKLSIKSEINDNLSVIKVGNEILATIDAETADSAGASQSELASTWSKQLRNALGLQAALPSLSSPGMSKKYRLPLSTEYFDLSNFNQRGQASWYGGVFNGRRSADGSRFDQNGMTAAHRYLPFGTVVKVTNNRNGKSCLVQITDRGPFSHGRIIDVSKGAASALGMIRSGVANVTIQKLTPRKSSGTSSKLANRS